MSDSLAGPVVLDVSSRPMTVENPTVGHEIYLKVSADCRRGATVDFPADAATVVRQARAKDGALAAVVLAPRRISFNLTVHRTGERDIEVAIRLDDLGPYPSLKPTSSPR
ncbi:MAG: hypothetical protein ABIQ09_17985 [Jatrophihabitantaceae bacterium]